MAVISVMAGGILGFFSLIVALATVEISWFAAIGLWWLSGSLFALLALAWILAPKAEQPAQQAVEQA